MAKRAARAAARRDDDRVTPFPRQVDSWDPLETQRDQSYVRRVKPYSEGQKELIEAIETHNLSLAIGPAGTGKTYLAIAAACRALEEGTVGRILLSRPAIEAGENLGYLPGTMEEKLSPYLRPLYDALAERLSGKRVEEPDGRRIN